MLAPDGHHQSPAPYSVTFFGSRAWEKPVAIELGTFAEAWVLEFGALEESRACSGTKREFREATCLKPIRLELVAA